MNNKAGNNSTQNVGKNTGNSANNANKPAANNASNGNKPAANNASNAGNANKPAANNASNANVNKPAANNASNANVNKPAANNASNANKPAANNASNANKPAANNAGNANKVNGNNGNKANANKPAANNAGNANKVNSNNANKPAANNAGNANKVNGNNGNKANANKPSGNKFGEMLSENTLDDIKNSVTDSTNTNIVDEQSNILKRNLGDDLYDKIKIALIIVIVLVIVGVIGYLLYKKFRSKYTESKSVYYLENISTSDPNVIPDCELTKPKDGFNYSIHLTIYIDNYYNNYGTWRHIFHKGTPIEKGKILDYRWYDETNDSWDEVLADMPRQAPGLWLHPNQNTLRFVLETEYEKEHCPLEHANPKTSLRLSSKKPIEFNSPKSQIQYMDIPDIPFKLL